MIVEIRIPAGMTPNDFSAAVRRIHRPAVKRVERRNKNLADDHYVCLWNDAIAAVPTEAAINTAAVDAAAEKSNEDAAEQGAKQKILNNAATIRSARASPGAAADALDAVAVVDTTSLASLGATLRQRQGAMFFLLVNLLVAVIRIGRGKQIPDEFIDEFLRQ